MLAAMLLLTPWLQVKCAKASTFADELLINRVTPLTVKVIFTGPQFDSQTLDVPLLKSLLPENKSNLILSDEVNTDTSYRLAYEFLFATVSFRAEFSSFLKSIEVEKQQENPWFYLFEQEDDWFSSPPSIINAYVYDARAVENWLIEHMGDFGGFPENGYVLFISDLRDLPSISYAEVKAFLEARTYGLNPPPVKAHYYSVNYTDLDRGYSLRNRDLAVGWGGSSRMWYVDLSAGPTSLSPWYDLPIQVVEEDQGVNPDTYIGGLWLTEFLADHVMEFVYNLAAPNFVYDPPLAEEYRIEVKIIDSRTDEEKQAVPITGTFNPELVKKAFENLVPYSRFQVNVQFVNVSDYPDLRNLMKTNSGFTDSWIYRYLFLTPLNVSYTDATPIYEYLKKNMGEFVQNNTRDQNTYVIPVFAFALSNDTYFTFKYKWIFMKPDLETGGIWGVTFKELILVGLNQRDFTRGNDAVPKQEDKGFGFTETVIHEVGHALGLMHPHTYGELGDFESSAMSYYAYEYDFSAFDKDALQRAHLNKILSELQRKNLEIEAAELKNNATNFLERMKVMISNVNYEYSRMNYTGAMAIALEARAQIDEALDSVAEQLPNSIEQLIADRADLKTAYERSKAEYNSLNDNYTQLNDEYDKLKTDYDQLRTELETTTNQLKTGTNESAIKTYLIYVFAATTVLFVATTVYLARRKTRTQYPPPPQ